MNARGKWLLAKTKQTIGLPKKGVNNYNEAFNLKRKLNRKKKDNNDDLNEVEGENNDYAQTIDNPRSS